MKKSEKQPTKPLDEYSQRKNKLESIREQGINPYPATFRDDRLFVEQVQTLSEGSSAALAGRIMSMRDMGKIIFCHIQDATGRFQLVLKEDAMSVEQLQQFREIFDVADFIGVHGQIFTTQKGELSLLVTSFVLLGKALRPLPEKWHGLQDTETKYRQRYLDLIINSDAQKTFKFRSHFIQAVRQFYWQEGFLEVETPTFLHSATGATAQPYKTHNNALDIDVYLRISHELPLKELIVGGFEKIFELGKAFRNEGFDPSHLPEHTHLEHYCAYWDFEDNIEFTEKMFTFLFEQLHLPQKMYIADRDDKKREVDWSTPWPRVNFIELLKQDTGIDILEFSDSKTLLAAIKKTDISFEGMDDMSLPGLVDNLYKKVSRPKLISPTILYHYPKYLQPLARVNDDDPRIVDQFQLVVNGWEIVKAYSELVDPVDQKQRFDEQKDAKKQGELEVMEGDEDFVVALEHGAPPISGWGMGIDRVIALLTGNSNLRDVVLFPLMRPKK